MLNSNIVTNILVHFLLIIVTFLLYLHRSYKLINAYRCKYIHFTE